MNKPLSWKLVLVLTCAIPVSLAWGQTNSSTQPDPSRSEPNSMQTPHPPSDLKPGALIEIQFPELTVDTFGKPAACHLVLPAHYDPAKPYGLAVWLAGGGGNNKPDSSIYPPDEFIGVGLPYPKGASSYTKPSIFSIFWMADLLASYQKKASDVWEYQRPMIDEVLKRIPNVQKSRNLIGGFSNGAHTIDLLLRIKGAEGTNLADYFSIFVVADGGGWAQQNPYPPLKGKFAYVCWGQNSSNASHTKTVVKFFQDAGATTSTSEIAGAGHAFPSSERAKAKEWVETKVLPALTSHTPINGN